MSTAVSTSSSAGPSGTATTLRTAVLAAVAVTLVLLAFAWPTFTSKARDVPLVVAGPTGATARIEQNLAAAGGAFEVDHVADRAEAVERIRHRDAYGAVVVGGPGSVEVLTATAASPLVAQALGQSATALGEKSGAKVTVTDVVPLSADDPRGAGLSVAALPLAMGGMIGGVLISLLLRGGRSRLGGIVGYGVLGGLALALVLQTWFGYIGGAFLGNVAIIGVALAATAAIIAGFQSLVGQAGIGIGAVLTMFVGNPLSGAMLPPQFLPGAWGQIGQWLVPGASSTLLRLQTYFPDADVVQPWTALLGWLVIGMLLVLLGHHRQARRAA